MTGAAGRRPRHSAAEIEQDLDSTRRDITATVAALKTRFTPDNLVREAVTYASRDGFGGRVVRTARDNPLPLILTGIGLAWLAAQVTRSAESRDPDRAAGDTRAGTSPLHPSHPETGAPSPVPPERRPARTSTDASSAGGGATTDSRSSGAGREKLSLGGRVVPDTRRRSPSEID